MEEKVQKEHQIYNDFYLYEKIGKMESDVEYLKEDVNRRFDDMEKSIDKRFDDVNRKFDNMEKSIDRRFDDVNRRFDNVDRRFDRMYILMGLGFTVLAILISLFKFL